jgi:hypothetical protein
MMTTKQSWFDSFNLGDLLQWCAVEFVISGHIFKQNKSSHNSNFLWPDEPFLHLTDRVQKPSEREGVL